MNVRLLIVVIFAVIVDSANSETAKSLLQKAYQAENAGNDRKAAEFYLKAHNLDPNILNAAAHTNLGATLAQSGDLVNGLKHLQIASKLGLPDPLENSQLNYNIGQTFQRLGQHDKAVEAFVLAVNQDPKSFSALMSGAWSLKTIGDLPRAAGFLQRASALNPKNPTVHVALGEVLNNLKRWKEAVVSYKNAIKLNPKSAETHVALAQTHLNIGDTLLAVENFAAALKISPKNGEALAGLWVANLELADWRDFNGLFHRVEAAVNASFGSPVPSPLSPYHTLFSNMNGPLRKRLSGSWTSRISTDTRGALTSQKISEVTSVLPVSPPFDFGERRVRIAYVSRRIEDYAGTLLMLGIFSRHDRRKFRVYCFASGPDDGSSVREKVRRDVDEFYDISMNSIPEMASAVNSKKINILIDYDGLHSLNNLPMLSLRPSQVQVTWLGFAGTVGDKSVIDFLLSDSVVTPPETSQYFSEKLIFLPKCYQPRDSNQNISPEDETRASHSLPDNAIVYSSFNRVEKLEPVMFDTWMKILSENSSAVLWLLGHGKPFVSNLKNQAKLAGIDPNRIIFAPKVKNEKHLRRIALADLTLDTQYYNAHTTASDSLFMGVPILTFPGELFPSRVAASILLSMNLPHFIARNLDDFHRLAPALALTRHSAPFDSKFDTDAFTASLDRTLSLLADLSATNSPTKFHLRASAA